MEQFTGQVAVDATSCLYLAIGITSILHDFPTDEAEVKMNAYVLLMHLARLDEALHCGDGKHSIPTLTEAIHETHDCLKTKVVKRVSKLPKTGDTYLSKGTTENETARLTASALATTISRIKDTIRSKGSKIASCADTAETIKNSLDEALLLTSVILDKVGDHTETK
jgi:hypothetical protein